MKAIDMKAVYRDYKGKWVALEGPTSNKVVTSGKNLEEVMKEAEKKGFSMPMVAQMPKNLLRLHLHKYY